MPCDCQRKNAEKLLKLGLKVKDNELKGTAFSSTGNFGFLINEHIDLGLKYDPNTGIYGMDFFTVLARKGKRVARRKHQRSRLGNFQKVTKEDAKNWFKEKLNGTIIKYIIKIINDDKTINFIFIFLFYFILN